MIASLTFAASSHTACASVSFSSYPAVPDRSEMGSNLSLIPSRVLRWYQCARPLLAYGQDALKKGYLPLGFTLIPNGAAFYIKPAQPLKDVLNLSLYPLWFLSVCEWMWWSAGELVYLAKFQKRIERRLDPTNKPSAPRAETSREDSQPTARPGCL